MYTTGGMADGSAEEEDLLCKWQRGRGNLLDSILAHPPALTLTLTWAVETCDLPDLS